MSERQDVIQLQAERKKAELRLARIITWDLHTYVSVQENSLPLAGFSYQCSALTAKQN